MSWHSASVISWAAHFKKLAMVKTFFSTPLTSPPSLLGGTHDFALTDELYRTLPLFRPTAAERRSGGRGGNSSGGDSSAESLVPPSKLGGDGNNYAAMTYIGYQRLKVALPDFGELTRSSLLSKKYGDRVGKVNIAVNLLNP